MKAVYLKPLYDDKWAWVFYYEQSYKQGGGSGWSPEFLIAVLMDGQAVEPAKVDTEQ